METLKQYRRSYGYQNWAQSDRKLMRRLRTCHRELEKIHYELLIEKALNYPLPDDVANYDTLDILKYVFSV